MEPTWTVEVRGPDGVKSVNLADSQVQYFKGANNGDPYETAMWLAYADLWYRNSGE